jgi:hypothetical protein
MNDMRNRLASLAFFLGAGILSFLVNTALYRAVLDWRSPFETFEQSVSPLALLVGEAFVAGLVVGLALTAAGSVAARIRLLSMPDKVRRYSLLLNLALFALALPLACLLLWLLAVAFPPEVPWGVGGGIASGILLFVVIPLAKLLVVRRALVGFVNVSLTRVSLAILVYWVLLSVTVYLAYNFIAEIGWVGKISSAEGPALAVILWIWLFVQGPTKVLTTNRG